MKRFLTVMLCMLLALVPAVSASAAFYMPAGLQIIEEEAFAGDASISGVLSLPDTVVEIGSRAFAGTSVYGLNLSDRIQSVGSGVLANTGAMYIQIPSIGVALANDALSGVNFVIAPEGNVSDSAPGQGVFWMDTAHVFFHDGFLYCYTTADHDAVEMVFPSQPGLSGEFTVPETVNGVPVVSLNEFAFTGLYGLTKVTLPEGVTLPANSVGWAEDLEIVFEESGSGSDPMLPDDGREQLQFFFEEESLVLHPGECYQLNPIDTPEGEYSGHSSDDSVASLLHDYVVEAYNCGSATLTAWIEPDADADVIHYATIPVEIVPGDPEISCDTEELTLSAGEVRAIYWNAWSSSMADVLKYTYTSDDEGIAVLDERGFVTGVNPGTTTVSLTVCTTDGAEAVSSVTVTVTESSLTLNHAALFCYDGFEYQLALTDELPEGATVAWSSTSEAISVDQNGLVTTITDEDEVAGSGLVICTVTYADGETAEISCFVNHRVFYIEFSEPDGDPQMDYGSTCESFVQVDYSTFPEDADKMHLTLTSSDDSIVSIDEEQHLQANSTGTVTITVTAEFLGVTKTTQYTVEVLPPEFTIESEFSEYDLPLSNGEQEFSVWYSCPIHIDNVVVTTSDSTVVKAFIDNDRLHLIPVNAGSATVTVTLFAGGVSESASISVTVTGYQVSLSESSITLEVGQSFQLSPVASGSLEIDYDYREYHSSDDSIVSVGWDGCVTGLRAGTAMIRLETQVNGEYAEATCLVTVTDKNAALTLSHTALHLTCTEQVQLHAYINGEEATGGEWSVTDTGLSISPSGLLTLRHNWPEDHAAYVTYTLEVDGETLTATCMVTGRFSDVTLKTEPVIISSAGETFNVPASFSSTVEGETYTLRMTSSDETIASFTGDGYDLQAHKAGVCTVTIELLDSKGVVVATRNTEIRIDAGYPEMTKMAFSQDVYYLSTNPDFRSSTWTDPVIEPTRIWNLGGEFSITSSDEDVVTVDGETINAAGEGTATLTMKHSLYPDWSATAEVVVYTPEFTATATEVESGNTVTFSANGIPGEVIKSLWWEKNDYLFTYVDGGWTSIELRSRHQGDDTVRVHMNLIGFDYTHEFPITVTGDSMLLNFSDVIIEPGKREYLYPTFPDYWDEEWSSSDESVMTVDDQGNVLAVGYGECVITLKCQTGNGPVEAICRIKVEEGEWSISDVNGPDVMFVDDCTEFHSNIYATRYAWPDTFEWSVSDPSLMEIDYTEDGYISVNALAAGTVDVTLTCTEGEQVDTFTKTVLITEAPVRLADSALYLRPGSSGELSFITAAGLTITDVQWTLSDSDALSVDDENNVTLLAESGMYSLTAAITLSDGKTYTLTAFVYPIADEDVYVDGRLSESVMYMTYGEQGHLYMNIDTNAAEEEVEITWESTDTSILVIDETSDFAGSRVQFRAVGDGDVFISCRVRIGDIYDETFYCSVTVYEPNLSIDLSYDSIECQIVNRTQQVSCSYHCSIHEHSISVTSSNPEVVRASLIHDQLFIQPLSSGSAVITATITVGKYSRSDTMAVTVYGTTISLNLSELEMKVGDVYQLSPVVSDGQNLDYSSRHYSSSDPEIVHVNGEGTVTALKPGTARICLQTSVDGWQSLAECIVTVRDETNPLTLNADTLSLSRFESFQLKALWNGEEITDAVWSVSDNGILISTNGLVRMYHTNTDDYTAYATATVERDGKTYTASCLIIGKYSDVVIDADEALHLEVGETHWLNPFYSTSTDYGALTLNAVSSDEKVVTASGRDLEAVAPGTAEVTIQLVTEDDVVVGTAITTVYVEQDLPDLDSIAFAFDKYYLNVGFSVHSDPRTEPRLYQELEELVLSSSNEAVAIFDGYNLVGVGPGEATISVYSPLAPDRVATATVYVYDWQVNIDKPEAEVNTLVTATITGMDASQLTKFSWQTHEGLLRFVEQKDEWTYVFRTMGSGEVWLTFMAEFPHSTLQKGARINITGDFLALNETDAFYEPGHEFRLEPTFWAENQVWSSTNESVATVDQNGQVTVHAVGECEIVLNCTAETGDYTTSCALHAAYGEWTLTEIAAPDIVNVGNQFSIDYAYDRTYHARPETVVASVTGDALQKAGDFNFYAAKTGTATITLTATEGDKTQTISKTIHVVQPAVTISVNGSANLRPGATAQVEITPAPGREITRFTWSVSDEAALTVTDGGLVTMLAQEGHYSVTASVTMDDGLIHTLTAWFSVIPDSELWWNLNMDGYMSMEFDETRNLYSGLNTNAGEHEVEIEWTSDNESIATVEPDPNSRMGSTAKVYGANGGTATITCTFKIGGVVYDQRTCTVDVSKPTFTISFNNSSPYELNLRDNTQHLNLSISTSTSYENLSIVSSNPEVVTATIYGENAKLTPIRAGEADVTVSMTKGDRLISTDTLHVVVIGSPVELSPSEVTLEVGESIVISPVLGEKQVQNPHIRSFRSSNENVAIIDDAGTICAVGAGVAYIYLDTEIDYDTTDGITNYVFARGMCTVTVTDSDASLTLNATELFMTKHETFQMKALWKGEEISDAVWTCSNGLTVSSTGLVYADADLFTTDYYYVTATLERDGRIHTATCAVRGKDYVARIEMPQFIKLEIGENRSLDIKYVTTDLDETYTLTLSSSDPAILSVDSDERRITALSAGTVTLTATLTNSSGETVTTHNCMVSIDDELPELDFIGFERDVYFLTVSGKGLGNENQYTAPYTIPASIRDHADVVITVEDPTIVGLDGFDIIGLKPGETTITLTHPLYPGKTGTAKVYVFDPNPTITANTIKVGETATLSVCLDPIPEEYIKNVVWSMNDYIFAYASGGWDTWTIRGRHEGSEGIMFYLDLPEKNFGYWFDITVEGSAYLLNASDLITEPGNEHYLWPDGFDAGEQRTWSSSDPSVATVSQDGVVTTLDYGSCDITLTTTDISTGDEATATCHVTVADGEWHLESIGMLDMLYVGNTYTANFTMSSYYDAQPDEYQWSSSDPSVLVYNAEDNLFEALKPGTVTVSITAAEGTQVETISKTLHVIEPPVRLETTSPSLRPDASQQLTLITAADRSIKSVTYVSEEPGALQIDANGRMTMISQNTGMRYGFSATVTLDDDSVHLLRGWCYCIPDYEVDYFFSFNTDFLSLQLGVNTIFSDVSMWTNAGEHETRMTWRSSNESILKLGEQSDGINRTIELIPVSTGSAFLYCFLEIGNTDPPLRTSTIELTVRVDPNPHVSLKNSCVELRPGQTFEPDVEFTSDLTCESIEYSVDSEDHLRVSEDGVITVLASGGTYNYYIDVTLSDGSEVRLCGEIRVIPDDMIEFSASMSPIGEMTMVLGEASDILMYINTNAAPEEIYTFWTTSDSNVVAIRGDDAVQDCRNIAIVAVGEGTATITGRVEIGENACYHADTFYLTVTVTQ